MADTFASNCLVSWSSIWARRIFASLAPDNLTVRIIRGSVAYELPPMFSREKTAQDDYLFVVKAAQAGARVSPERLSEIYYKLGQLSAKRRQVDVANKFYARARSVAPRSIWAEKARKAGR